MTSVGYAATPPTLPALVLKSGESTAKLNGVGKVGETVGKAGNLTSGAFCCVAP